MEWMGRMTVDEGMIDSSLNGRRIEGIAAGIGILFAWTTEGELVTVGEEHEMVPPRLDVFVRKVALGDTMVLLLDGQGRVWLWERRAASTWVQVLVDKGVVVDIAVGWDHALVLTKSSLFSMGSNQYGQCGIGVMGEERLSSWHEIVCPVSFTSLACGAFHSCAISAGGELFVWGSNREGQLGPQKGASMMTVSVPTIQQHEIGGLWVDHVSCGLYHTAGCCRSTRTAFGFGSNQYGALGPDTPFFLPVEDVAQVRCGHRHTVLWTGSTGEIIVYGWPSQQPNKKVGYSKMCASHWITVGITIC